MKPKLIYTLVLLFLVKISLFSQIVNVNPDPNGDPWIAGDVILLSTEEEDSIPNMVLSSESAGLQLPSYVDNSNNIYMPPVFKQGNSYSCVQVAEVWYAFTYEINRLRNLNSGSEIGGQYIQNQYHPWYTYNYLNGGVGTQSTQYSSGFDILAENGCPNYSIYNDSALLDSTHRYQYWMNGYDKYKSALTNKISNQKGIRWTDNLDSLDLLKHWLADHNSTDTISTGGVAVLAVYETSWKPDTTLPQGSPMAGQKYLYELGTSGPHEITIVGYHDSVHCFDLNGDGEYKNTDLDGDSIIQLDECELGALYIVNSYGETFGNLGYIWLPYKLLAGTGVQGKTALTCLSTDNYSPDLTVKVKVEHELRDYQTFKIGYAEDASKENYTKSTWTRIFKNQGGGLDMRGCYEGPIEVGFDFSYYYGNEDFGKIFLSVTEKDKDEAFYYDGEIKSYSIIDYRWGETFELESDSFNVELLNQAETILSIDYDLIPHESNITSDLFLFSNMVSRFMPTVDNNSTLTVNDSVRVDMYSSEIYIKSGSTLVLEDNAVILAKRGNCKITIDGDIDVGSGVTFEAEDGASLEVVISNSNLYSNFTNVTFKKSKLTNFGESLTISNSLFDECPRLYSLKGSVTINNNTIFNKSSVYLSDETSGQSNNVIIQGCTFTRLYQSPPQDYYAAVEVWNYSNFYIENNDISGYNSGVIISQSGGGLTGNQIINNNELSNLNTSGILTFSSTATLWSNYIHDNQFGVRFTNNSNISMQGYSYKTNYDDINYITDNSSYEVHATNAKRIVPLLHIYRWKSCRLKKDDRKIIIC